MGKITVHRLQWDFAKKICIGDRIAIATSPVSHKGLAGLERKSILHFNIQDQSATEGLCYRMENSQFIESSIKN